MQNVRIIHTGNKWIFFITKRGRMSNVYVQNGIIIPEDELIIETSRAGGPGGQHVNKTNSRVVLRWNIVTSRVLTEEQKEHVGRYFQSRLTHEGELIIAVSTMRSQHQNKELAYERLAQELRSALYIPKKRVPTSISKTAKEKGAQHKKRRSLIKKFRGSVQHDE